MATLLAIGCVSAALFSPGMANAATSDMHPLVSSPAVATAPPGYVVVDDSAVVSAGSEAGFNVLCPAGTVVYGGGISNTSTSLGVFVNASEPFVHGQGWNADVFNESGSDSTFDAYAICANQPKGYAIVATTIDVGTGTQGSEIATCPGKSKVLGGGGEGAVDDSTSNLISSFPASKKAWRVENNNVSGETDTLAAVVICGKKVKGLTRVTGSPTLSPAGTQTGALATCPHGLFPIGGGVASTGGILAHISETLPSVNEWVSRENNASGVGDTITPYAVCAGKR